MSLSDNNVKTNYATACQRLWATFQSSSVIATQRALIRAVNVGLSDSGVPEVGMQVNARSADNGTFQFNTWNIAFGGAIAAMVKSSAMFIGMVNTVYHEARHCEQWFRIAQALAAGTAPKPMIPPPYYPDKDDAAAIANFMGIEKRIADEAVANPEQNQVASKLVNAWFESIYGVRGSARGARLGRLAHPGLSQNDYQKYLVLAEEQDAWRLGDELGEKVREDARLKFPIPYDWTTATARSNLHFRSGRFIQGTGTLVNVDRAVETLHNTPTMANFAALKTAFGAWAAANPKEFSKRNGNTMFEGSIVGVLTLMDEILKHSFAEWRMGNRGLRVI